MSKFIAVLIFAMMALASARLGDFQIECTPQQRNAAFCPTHYSPVCGHNPHLRCIRAPCPNTRTFSNACEACMNPLIFSYTEGPCSGSTDSFFF